MGRLSKFLQRGLHIFIKSGISLALLFACLGNSKLQLSQVLSLADESQQMESLFKVTDIFPGQETARLVSNKVHYVLSFAIIGLKVV